MKREGLGDICAGLVGRLFTRGDFRRLGPTAACTLSATSSCVSPSSICTSMVVKAFLPSSMQALGPRSVVERGDRRTRQIATGAEPEYPDELRLDGAFGRDEVHGVADRKFASFGRLRVDGHLSGSGRAASVDQAIRRERFVVGPVGSEVRRTTACATASPSDPMICSPLTNTAPSAAATPSTP